jgi:hypothetical protein
LRRRRQESTGSTAVAGWLGAVAGDERAGACEAHGGVSELGGSWLIDEAWRLGSWDWSDAAGRALAGVTA